MVITWLSRRPPLDRIIRPEHFHDAGNLTLAFVMLWAYFAFSQALIIWAGNLPQEIAWYQHRLQTGWRFIGLALVLFHFAVPFLVLLSRRVKRESTTLARLALWIWRRASWISSGSSRPTSIATASASAGSTSCFRVARLIWLAAFVWAARGRAISRARS